MNNRFSVMLAVSLAIALIDRACCAQSLFGHVEQHSFIGPITNQSVQFNIYLPENYDAAGNDDHYPTVYHLHGIGGSQGGPQNMIVPGSFEAAKAKGVIGDVIIVFANGYMDSFWADGIGGDNPAETDVIAQLIAHVDANFRTIPLPGSRIIQGFSMGGFGAVKFYAKFPDLFAACVEYDGAMVTWPIMLQFHSKQAATIFGDDEDYFDQYSPWHWSTEHASILQDKPPLRMVVGTLVGGNQNFRDHLQSLGIPVEYVVTGCEHQIGCLLEAQGLASAAFIAQHLQCAAGKLAADLDDDFDVDVDDLLLVINNWGAVGSNPADVTGNEIIDIDDLLAVINAWGGCR